MFVRWHHGLRRRLHWAWIAAAAVLLNVLAPSVSMALSARQPGAAPAALVALAELCATGTGLGVQVREAFRRDRAAGLDAAGATRAAASDTSGPAHAAADGHCPFCLPHAGSFALPPAGAPAAWAPAAAPAGGVAPSAIATVHPRPRWVATAPPRAPPAAA